MLDLNAVNNQLSGYFIRKYFLFGLVFLVGSSLLFSPAMMGQGFDPSRCDYKPIHGTWYIGWDRASYGSGTVERDLYRIKNGLCSAYISLQANVHQDNKYSSDPYIGDRTVDDETLANVVNTVHELGMKVVLLTPLRPDDGTWEGEIQPRDLESWFDHWEQILVHYAKFAEEHEVEVLLLGSELPTLRDVSGRWKRIIEEVRKHYSGEISFSVNFWTKRSEFREILNMTQWEDMDYIGITGYFELTPSNNPSIERLRRAWTSDLHGQNVIEDLKRLRNKFDKPVVFWEIGYQSKNGTNTYPWNYLKEGKKDEGEQRDSWIGFLRAIKDKEWIHGFMAFAEQVGLPRDKPGYHGYNMLRKKTETVFCSICQ